MQIGEQIFFSGLRAAALRRLASGRACGRSACRSLKIADNACGVVSLPAKTMAGIPPAAGTLYFMYFKILGQRQAAPAAKGTCGRHFPARICGVKFAVKMFPGIYSELPLYKAMRNMSQKEPGGAGPAVGSPALCRPEKGRNLLFPKQIFQPVQ